MPTTTCLACMDVFLTDEAAESHFAGEFVEEGDREEWLEEGHEAA